MSKNPDLLKLLFNLDRFLYGYLNSHKDSEHQALNMVFAFLQTKLSGYQFMDERLQAYLMKFDELIQHDFTLEQNMSAINTEFDTISHELMTLFMDISQTVDGLSQEAVSTSDHLRHTIQRQFVISIGIAFLFLLFLISRIARKIINPSRHISRVVLSVKSRNEKARFRSQEQDEIAELGFVLNEMLDTINKHHI